MQLRARLPNLQQLPLQPSEDMVERPGDVTVDAPTADNAQGLRLRWRAPITPALGEQERGGAVWFVGMASRFEGKIVVGDTGRFGCVCVIDVGPSVFVISTVRRMR
jgi:hypothetical protein